MASTTVVFGAVLIVLGLAGFLSTSGELGSALVPALFGLALLASGVFAHRESSRKSAMHIAVGLALLGCLGSFRGVAKVRSLMNGSASRPIVIELQLATFAICALFLWLCIRSFQEAARAGRGSR